MKRISVTVVKFDYLTGWDQTKMFRMDQCGQILSRVQPIEMGHVKSGIRILKDQNTCLDKRGRSLRNRHKLAKPKQPCETFKT
eukprot:scaffold12737_cov79-Cylindrotheca_fusiformis.AAC.3